MGREDAAVGALDLKWQEEESSGRRRTLNEKL